MSDTENQNGQGGAAAGTIAGGGAGAGAGGAAGQGNGAAAGQQQQAATEWPADWRERLVGDDKDYLKTLSRMASPTDLFKKARSLEQKLSSGEYKRNLPDNATEEQKAEWRKEQGIPEKPEAYLDKIALPNGMVLGEADKPIAASFAKMAHEKNWTPNQYNDALAWYYQNLDEQRAVQAEADDVFRTESLTALKDEFGANFKREINLVDSFVGKHFPKEVAENLLIARTPDGRLLGDNPVFVKALAALAREMNPLGTLLPAGTGDPGKAAAERLTELKGLMAKSGSEYWTGPKAEQLQEEYRKLIEGQQKMQARSAA